MSAEDNTPLTADRLREVFHYDPRTGKFRRYGKSYGVSMRGEWRPRQDGYIAFSVDSKTYKAHRLAWLYVYGQWPSQWLDHVNGMRHDNRIANLRLATPPNNARHGRGWKRRKQRLKGVYPQKKSKQKPWYSAIRVDRKLIYLGSFPTQKKAHAAYVAAARKHFGDFAHAG